MHTPKSWQKQLSEGFVEPIALFKRLEIEPHHLETVGSHPFTLRVPESFVSRMKKGDIHDPLLRQILPLKEESVSILGFSQDPLQERGITPVPGLLHKYASRVLLTLTGACAVHCRYCFRRNFPYEANNPGNHSQDKVLAYIEAHPQVEEVILSGGDPLVVPDQTLARWVTRLAALPQIKLLRIHTRLPIVLPDRITDELVALLTQTHLQVVVVLHCNHPQEMDESVAAAVAKLNQAAITVLNQGVLLKGVNDNLQTLIELQKKLFQARVLPYYLHVLDKVSGTRHFDIPDDEAQRLWAGMLAVLPGYLVPRLVREEPGKTSKTWL